MNGFKCPCFSTELWARDSDMDLASSFVAVDDVADGAKAEGDCDEETLIGGEAIPQPMSRSRHWASLSFFGKLAELSPLMMAVIAPASIVMQLAFVRWMIDFC